MNNPAKTTDPTASRTPIRIFISYARKDGAVLARRLFDSFEARPGWSAWMDSKLHAEELFSHEIQKALLAADYVVVVLSPDVNRDNPPSFVQRELLFATQEEVDKKVFAVKASPCFVPVIIAGVTWLPFHTGDFDANFETLCAKIEYARTQPKPSSNAAAAPAPNRRELELAYLRDLAKQYGVWGKVYTDLSAERRQTPDKPAPKIEDDATMSLLADMFGDISEHVEMAFAQHTPSGHSADDDAEKLPLETFASLTEAINKFPRLALLGDPGCGKTTTLRRIALDLALAATNDETNTAPLPILVPLGNFNGGRLDDYLATNFGGLSLREYLPDRVVVLLDGLNETAAEHVPEVQRWLNANPKTQVIVTCRKLDYLERKLDLQRVDVQPLDVFRIRQFMVNWGLSSNAVDELFWGLSGTTVLELWNIWRDAGDTFERFWTVEKLESGMPAGPKMSQMQGYAYGAMLRAMSDDHKLPGLLGLVSNPFLLTQTIFIYGKRRAVPRSRGELFTLFVAALMEQRGKLAITKQRTWIDAKIQRGALAALATWLQGERKQTFASTEDILAVFGQFIGRGAEKPDDLLTFAISANILEKGRDTLRFSHQLLQEYFAAYGMEEALKRGESSAKYFPGEQWWLPSGWEESAVLLCGMYISSSNVSVDAWQVVAWLTPVNPIVAWRCITENGMDENHDLANALKAPPTGVRVAPFARERWGVEVADHDTRPGVGLRPDGLPDIAWCEVHAGEFVMGSVREYDHNPVRHVVLPTFYIAKYPVTYAQFQAFIDAPDGFNNLQWWKDLHEDGLRQQKRGPRKQHWPIANHPRENVSWYDAMAFCRWLSAKLGYAITLPTDEQWEKAARGTDGREYPYPGEFDPTRVVNYPGEFDPTRSNTIQTGIDHTSAVGIFLDGASPYGVFDMSGNVWEWTLTEYKSRRSNMLDNNESRSMRGGSWFDLSNIACAAFRRGPHPGNWADDDGFRLACSAPV